MHQFQLQPFVPSCLLLTVNRELKCSVASIACNDVLCFSLRSIHLPLRCAFKHVQVYSVEGELQWLPALNLLPISLQCLSVIHASPLRLPPCLPHLPSLARLHLSECSLVGEDGDDFAAPLVAATQLQVRPLERVSPMVPLSPTYLPTYLWFAPRLQAFNCSLTYLKRGDAKFGQGWKLFAPCVSVSRLLCPSLNNCACHAAPGHPHVHSSTASHKDQLPY